MNPIISLSICLVLGQVLNLGVQIDAKNEEAIAKGEQFHLWRDFLRRNRIKIFLSILSGIIALILYNEISAQTDKVGGWKMSLFILIGFTGSELVIKYLNKFKAKVETVFDNDGTGETETMSTPQYEYALAYGAATTITLSGKPYTMDSFASTTGGVNNSTVHEIVWQTQPSFTEVTLTFPDGKTSIAGPVRRPKNT